MTGWESWQASVKEEHAKGEAEYKAAQAKGYAEGTKDRISGKMDSVVGAVTGDKEQQASGRSTYLVRSPYAFWSNTSRTREPPPRQRRGSAEHEFLNGIGAPLSGIYRTWSLFGTVTVLCVFYVE